MLPDGWLENKEQKYRGLLKRSGTFSVSLNKEGGRNAKGSDGRRPVSDGEQAEWILTWDKGRGADPGGDQEIWKRYEGR